eukprot:6025963-Amphidinium_carterae.1
MVSAFSPLSQLQAQHHNHADACVLVDIGRFSVLSMMSILIGARMCEVDGSAQFCLERVGSYMHVRFSLGGLRGLYHCCCGRMR